MNTPIKGQVSNGRAGKKRGAFLSLLFLFCFCRDISADYRDPPFFELQAWRMGQMVYFIKVYENGGIYYFGDKIMRQGEPSQEVGVVGARTGHITQEQLSRLIDTFLSLPFKELEKRTTLTKDADTAEIIHFRLGHQQIDINDRPFFLATVAKLKTLVNIQEWICFPKGHPDYSEHCLDGSPDNFK